MVKYVKASIGMPDDWYDEMWKTYVPQSGDCDTEFGEILRWFSKISHKYYQNGDKYGYNGMNARYLDHCGEELIKHCPPAKEWLHDLMFAGKDGKYKTYKTALRALEDNIYHYLLDNQEELTK